MSTDSPSQGGRRHFHRSRRGHDRRGGDRRAQQQGSAPTGEREQAARGERGVDVEQIMREIRAKIAQRHGIELTDQQVQELAARRLESILDPRTIKPALLDQLRKAAGTQPDTALLADKVQPPFEFEDTTLYETPNGLLRFLRKLFNPILKLFFNPNPLIRAMNIQSRLNTEAVKREAERDVRQAEWNALHYELLQRVVSEIAKVSLEAQSLALKVESLSAKVDFNERRVRQIEGVTYQARQSGGRERDRDRDRERERDRDRDRDREQPPAQAPQVVMTTTAFEPATGGPEPAAEGTQPAEAPRRRRRRRRGRRGGGTGEAVAPGVAAPAAEAVDIDEGDEGDVVDLSEPAADAVTTEGEAIVETDTAVATALEPHAPERVTPQLEHIEPAAREVAAPEVLPPDLTAPEKDPNEHQ